MKAVAGLRVAKVLALNLGLFHAPFVPVVSGHLPKLLGQIARANIKPDILREIIEESRNLTKFTLVQTSLVLEIWDKLMDG